ncbi:MAG TPA: tRNA pseudouridine(55) synthase TruB [Cyclobacteriaceae bacterium]|nr:tRNA pseudouridine(55) synthase TruB [Cyclobacteriaceae bacterium]
MTQPVPGLCLLINKPLEWTSFDVVNKLRYSLKIKKIGHAGTLDPLATGLLIICTGPMTKKINEYQGMEKEYTGTFTLGYTTPSCDLETAPENPRDTSHITPDLLAATATGFTGIIKQIPPIHSSVLINGKRAYSLARKGQVPELQPREIEIKKFDIIDISMPVVSFRVVCSKGTYIRSLARDFGEKLNTGAYLSSLCRTRIGPYLLDDAMTIEQARMKFGPSPLPHENLPQP